jgi:Ca2+-binding EF-hand superfamily protein
MLYDLDKTGYISKEKCKEALKMISNNAYQTVEIDLI